MAVNVQAAQAVKLGKARKAAIERLLDATRVDWIKRHGARPHAGEVELRYSVKPGVEGLNSVLVSIEAKEKGWMGGQWAWVSTYAVTVRGRII